MTNLTKSFAQYKHYLILIVALLLANYIVLPLSEWQTEQQQTLALITKKSDKVNQLLSSKADYADSLKKVDSDLEQMRKFVFAEADEAKFKLSAQSKIENILNTSDCTIQRIDFKGDSKVDNSLSRWRVELRFTGDAVCLTQTTRGLESLVPNISIADFNVNHRGLTEEVKGSFNAVMNVSLWHLIEANE